MDELRTLVDLIERLHRVPPVRTDGVMGRQWEGFDWDAGELGDCIGFSEGQACCLTRVRESPEFAAALVRLRER